MRWGDYLHKAQVEERVCVYYSFVWFVYVAMCPPRPYTIYISYAYGTIEPICAESAVKHQQNKQTTYGLKAYEREMSTHLSCLVEHGRLYLYCRLGCVLWGSPKVEHSGIDSDKTFYLLNVVCDNQSTVSKHQVDILMNSYLLGSFSYIIAHTCIVLLRHVIVP